VDLQSLVDEFGKEIQIKKINNGGYIDGIWQGETETISTIFGVLLNLSYKDVKRLTSGDYTVADKKVIVKNEVELAKGDIIVDVENYKIEKVLDQSFHGNVKSYIASKVVN